MPIPLRALTLLLPLALPGLVLAEPSAQILTGSELPATVQVAKDKSLFIKAWTSPDRKWFLSQSGFAVSLGSEATDKTGIPAWTTVGKVYSSRGSLTFLPSLSKSFPKVAGYTYPSLLMITDDEQCESKEELEILLGRWPGVRHCSG